LSVPVVVALAIVACEQRYSGDVPQSPASVTPLSSSSALAEVLALGATDVGGTPSPPAMTVTSCAWPLAACSSVDADAAVGDSYRVVFGSGRAAIRSRGETTSDLYRELRDQAAARQRLHVEPRSPGEAGSSAGARIAPHAASLPAGSDAIMRSAFSLLDLVDTLGEVDVEVVYGDGLSHCQIALGRGTPDGGAAECLVREPERPQRSPMTKSVLSW
jgi:hypothetical protein